MRTPAPTLQETTEGRKGRVSVIRARGLAALGRPAANHNTTDLDIRRPAAPFSFCDVSTLYVLACFDAESVCATDRVATFLPVHTQPSGCVLPGGPPPLPPPGLWARKGRYATRGSRQLQRAPVVRVPRAGSWESALPGWLLPDDAALPQHGSGGCVDSPGLVSCSWRGSFGSRGVNVASDISGAPGNTCLLVSPFNGMAVWKPPDTWRAHGELLYRGAKLTVAVDIANARDVIPVESCWARKGASSAGNATTTVTMTTYLASRPGDILGDISGCPCIESFVGVPGGCPRPLQTLQRQKTLHSACCDICGTERRISWSRARKGRQARWLAKFAAVGRRSRCWTYRGAGLDGRKVTRLRRSASHSPCSRPAADLASPRGYAPTSPEQMTSAVAFPALGASRSTRRAIGSRTWAGIRVHTVGARRRCFRVEAAVLSDPSTEQRHPHRLANHGETLREQV
ncbi:hypothetical protein VTO73DRAFT_2318 [Trametes versicolor]